MLALGRKRGERLIIGSGRNQVVITVLKIKPNYVRLGIECNRDIPITREELLSPQNRPEQQGEKP